MIRICLVKIPYQGDLFVRDIQFPLNISLKFSTKPNKPLNGRKFIFSVNRARVGTCMSCKLGTAYYIYKHEYAWFCRFVDTGRHLHLVYICPCGEVFPCMHAGNLRHVPLMLALQLVRRSTINNSKQYLYVYSSSSILVGFESEEVRTSPCSLLYEHASLWSV